MALPTASRALGSAWLLTLAAFVGCEAQAPTVGSETHFLKRCPLDGECNAGLTCLCGACSAVCDTENSCGDVSQLAACVPLASRPGDQSCDAGAAASTCEVSCETDSDCLALGSNYHCDRRFCRSLAVDCEAGTTTASDVVFLGDLFLADNGQLIVELEELARTSGALGTGDAYRDYSSTLVSAFGDTNDLPSQYDWALADGPANIVVLDVGGADALVACPDPLTEDCPSLQNAALGTRDLLAQFASNGVGDVVLFFYPNPLDGALMARFDLLRPMLQTASEDAPLDCVFVDLRPTFTGREDELLGSEWLLPTPAGSAAAAATIWSAMQQSCVAQ